MAGIYIHIPFCKQACNYCDFHFSTKLKNRTAVIDAIVSEIEQRKNYLENQPIETIYFGGGTPSLLSEQEINQLFSALDKQFNILPNAEISLEANPDDLSNEKLKLLKSSPINRLSIGVQSFHEHELKFMNRAHSAEEAIGSIKEAQDHGFENLSIDLIFGNPLSTASSWQGNLDQFFSLNIPHLSAYSLTVEEKTSLAHQIKTGKVPPVEDEKAYSQFETLRKHSLEKGYEQYELSNYCKQEKYSKHNTSYWQQKHYLGLGPGAHSYNGKSRQWNISNNSLYAKAIQNQTSFSEQERLSERDRYNELLITSLRTKWGLSFQYLKNHFSEKTQSHFNQKLKTMEAEWGQNQTEALLVNPDFWFKSDELIRHFWLD